MTEAELLRALGDEDWRVRGAAAGNRNLPEAAAERLVRSRIPEILRALARNESVPDRIRVAAALRAGL